MRLKEDKNGSFFHPFEIALCGGSSDTRKTLIAELTKELTNIYDVGHLGQVNQEINIILKYLDKDFILLNDFMFSAIPKITFISKDSSYDELISQIKENKIQNIQAVITDSDIDPFAGQYPIFKRESISEITNFLLSFFKRKSPFKINGLVLSGGKSLRMNEDKGALSYHGQDDQVSHTRKLLEAVCDEVYVSCREDQKDLPFLKRHDLIFDSFPSSGPMTGILSAQYKTPNIAWLVVACDLPYLDERTLQNLIEKRNPLKYATAYINSDKKWPEPLCTIYEPKSYQKLLQFFSMNKTCPRKVLINSNIELLEQVTKNALDNINTQEQRIEANNFFAIEGIQ